MAVNFSVAARNARLDALETELGASPKAAIFTGAKPASCATADSGTELARMDLPADAMAAASSGAKSKSGTWEDLTGNAAGSAGYWRLYKNDGTTCVVQGTCGATGSGADMELDNVSIAVGQKVTVTAFTLTDGNA